MKTNHEIPKGTYGVSFSAYASIGSYVALCWAAVLCYIILLASLIVNKRLPNIEDLKYFSACSFLFFLPFFWLKGFVIKIEDGIFLYRNGYWKTKKIALKEIKTAKIETVAEGRFANIPMPCLVLRPNDKTRKKIIINIRSFSIKDLAQLFTLLGMNENNAAAINHLSQTNMDFQKTAELLLSYKLNSLGFNEVIYSQGEISFESSRYIFAITHCFEHSCHEINMKFGFKKMPTQYVYLSEVVHLHKSFHPAPLRLKHESDIPAGIEKLFSIFCEEIPDFPNMNEGALLELIQQAKSYRERITQDYVDGPARSKGNAAWKAKNYDTVIKEYNSIKGKISPIEYRRLKYAQKAISPSFTICRTNIHANEIFLKHTKPWMFHAHDGLCANKVVQKISEKFATHKIFCLDGVQMKTYDSLFEEMKKKMNFPDYFGRNLDALKDCLTDSFVMENGGKRSYSGFIVLIDNSESVLSNSTKEDVKRFLDLLICVAAEWSVPVNRNGEWDRPAKSFHVVFFIENENAHIFSKLPKIIFD